LLAGRAGRHPENARVVPAAADGYHLLLLAPSPESLSDCRASAAGCHYLRPMAAPRPCSPWCRRDTVEHEDGPVADAISSL